MQTTNKCHGQLPIRGQREKTGTVLEKEGCSSMQVVDPPITRSESRFSLYLPTTPIGHFNSYDLSVSLSF